MIPPELQRSVPREVTMTTAGRVLAVVAICLVMGGTVGAFLLWQAASNDAARAERYEREAVEGRGQVVEVKRAGGKDSRRRVTYDYWGNGIAYRGQSSVGQREAQSLQVGQMVPIFYVQSSPDVSWMAGHQPRGVPFFVAPLLSVGTLAGALGIIYSMRRQRYLLSNGRPTEAHVTGSKRYSKPKSGSAYHVDYEFTLLSGARCSGRYDVGSNPPSAGTAITVLYDPDIPSRQARYPTSLYRIDNT